MCPMNFGTIEYEKFILYFFLFFNFQENLRKHVICTGKHPGRFLYECQQCDGKSNKSFGTNNLKEYKMHLKNMHNQSQK